MASDTILCYGDSNTYGYDPRGPWGDRYDADTRWCTILGNRLGCPVINCGENGRTIPQDKWELQNLWQLIQHKKPDLLVLLLGTNDILLGKGSPDVIANRMECLLKSLRQDFMNLSICLLSPPQIHIPEFSATAEELSACYRELAQRQHISFWDSCHWDIPLAFDGIHFSEAGHLRFAERLAAALQK